MTAKNTPSLANVADQAGFYFQASMMIMKKVTTAAIEGYKSILTIDKNSQVEYYRDKGINYAKKGKYTQAVGLLEKSTRPTIVILIQCSILV